MSGLWAIGAAVWVLALVGFIYARHRYLRHRADRRLDYGWQCIDGEVSLDAWRRRCEASRSASRQRRGLDATR